MSNFIDYLDWRGDLSFVSSPFNAIDQLILSYLSYTNLDQIVPSPGMGSIALSNASDLFFLKHTQEELDADKSFIRNAPVLLKKAAETERFGNALLQNYINIVDETKELQFCALEILLSDGSSFVSYCGTDNTLVGWNEDFNMSFEIVPSDHHAVAFLNYIHQNTDCPIRIGGHSKGGHLSLYAALMCEKKIQDRILKIYDNDGPGFNKEFMKTHDFSCISDRIERYIPSSSLFGQLLEHAVSPTIIRSSNHSIMQHDCFSWQIYRNDFVKTDTLSQNGIIFNHTFNNWLDTVSFEERESFVNELFAVLYASGARTVTELQNERTRSTRAMLHELSKIDKHNREVIHQLLHIFINEWKESIPKLER